MSRVLLAVLLIASVVVADPPRVLGLLGPQAQAFGRKLKSVLDPYRILPQVSRIERR